MGSQPWTGVAGLLFPQAPWAAVCGRDYGGQSGLRWGAGMEQTNPRGILVARSRVGGSGQGTKGLDLGYR